MLRTATSSSTSRILSLPERGATSSAGRVSVASTSLTDGR